MSQINKTILHVAGILPAFANELDKRKVLPCSKEALDAMFFSTQDADTAAILESLEVSADGLSFTANTFSKKKVAVFKDDQWVVTTRQIRELDDNGEEIELDESAHDIVNTEYFTANGDLKEATITYGRVTRTHYQVEYNSLGQEVKNVETGLNLVNRKTPEDPDWDFQVTGSITRTISYDDLGRVICETVEDQDVKYEYKGDTDLPVRILRPDAEIVNEFDANGGLIKDTYYPLYATGNEDNFPDEAAKEAFFEMSAALRDSNKVVTVRENTYDDKGRLLTVATVEENGSRSVAIDLTRLWEVKDSE